MAVKDEVFASMESVANDGYHTIRPASGEEAVISYITVNSDGGAVQGSVQRKWRSQNYDSVR